MFVSSLNLCDSVSDSVSRKMWIMLQYSMCDQTIAKSKLHFVSFSLEIFASKMIYVKIARKWHTTSLGPFKNTKHLKIIDICCIIWKLFTFKPKIHVKATRSTHIESSKKFHQQIQSNKEVILQTVCCSILFFKFSWRETSNKVNDAWNMLNDEWNTIKASQSTY